MQATNKRKLFRILSLGLKILVCVATFWFIWHRLQATQEMGAIYQVVVAHFKTPHKQVLLLTVVLLMGLNWVLETVKWRFLITKIERLGFLTALKGVLSGITVSLFTPNRIGEYAGRVVYIQQADRLQGALITVISSLAQLIITLLVGALALIVFLFQYQTTHFGKIELYIAIQFYIIFACAVLLIFLNSSVITLVLSKWKFLRKRYEKYIQVFSFYSSKELAWALLLSLLRYAVFAIQYYLVLQFFEVSVTPRQALVLIPVYYVALTAIPTITLAELGIREVVSLSVFGLVATNEFGMVATSFLIWWLNLAIPAIFGAIMVLKAKIFKS